MRYAWVLLIALIFFVIVNSTAQEPPTYRIASYYIPLLVTDKDSGAFMEMLQEAAKRADIKYEIVMAPPKRAMRYFEDGEVIAIIPALRATLAKDAELTSRIFTKQIHAFVLEGNTLPQDIDALKGMRVGLTRGFAYPRAIIVNEHIEIDYADTTDGSLKKLIQGRVDVVVADGYTAVSAIKKMGLKGFKYDLSAVLHEQPAYIACQPTKEGAELARKLSIALDSMKVDGTLDSLLPAIKATE